MPSAKPKLPIPWSTTTANKTAAIGTWLTLAHPSIAEIIVQSGYDFVVVDIEHSSITLSQTEDLIRTVHLMEAPCLVRVGNNDATIIKRVMDSGASGVIVPMVNSAEEAAQAVAAVKYPPAGTRGVGLARAQRFGQAVEVYKTWVQQHSTVVVQIEHIQAVENIDSILSVEGVDAFIVGPYDLSGSVGAPGDFENPKFIEAMKTIDEAMIRTGCPGGFHQVYPDPEKVRSFMDKGYSFMAYGVDFIFLESAANNNLSQLKKIL